MGRRHGAGAQAPGAPASHDRLTTAGPAAVDRAAFLDAGGWPGVLARLVAGMDLEPEVAAGALGEVLDGEATSAQLAGFLVGLRAKGETVGEMTGMVEAMVAAAVPVSLAPGTDPVDTCGTGGSVARRAAAFNVSTLAALVAAAAGAVVCKHGNRAASSTSGSADLLEALGVAIDLGPEGVAACVAEVGIGFCFAPRFHPAMRHAGPTRRELGVATVFNVLGPLANPAGVRRQLVGVGDEATAERVLGVLRARGAERALVVCGHDGLDELTTATTSTVFELRGDEVRRCTFDPAELGVPVVPPSAVAGGDVATNVRLAGEVLGGAPGPHRNLVELNAAAALVAAGRVDDLAGGHELAHDALDSGAAAEVLARLVAVSQREAAGSVEG